MATAEKAIRPVDKLRQCLELPAVQEQFRNCLKEKAGAFISSLIDLYSSDYTLQQCDPNAVIMEAAKAASLDLPINKQLGFAYLVPYRVKERTVPQFQIGYKGYIQLALRTGQYRRLNAGIIPEGVRVDFDILSGDVRFSGKPTGDKPQGYFAYMELLNGFTKAVYMTKPEVIVHAKRYSKSFAYENSAWKTNFEEMAIKTALRKLLSHYAPLSTEQQQLVKALASDEDAESDENAFDREVRRKANKEPLDASEVTDATFREVEQRTGEPQEGAAGPKQEETSAGTETKAETQKQVPPAPQQQPKKRHDPNF